MSTSGTSGRAAISSDRVLAELTRLLRQICAQDRLDIGADTRLEDIAKLDSLRLLQAVAHLEDFFEVEIDAGALETLELVSDIVAAVRAGRPAGDSGAG